MLREQGEGLSGTGRHLIGKLTDRSFREVASGPGEPDMTALVGANTEFRGIIQYHGTVRIDGKVEGEIRTDGVLLIGKDAVIRATVSAGVIVCCGNIFGDVTATEAITLLAPAVLRGCVTTPLLSMEEGVQFLGRLAVNQDGGGEQALGGVPDQRVVEVANS